MIESSFVLGGQSAICAPQKDGRVCSAILNEKMALILAYLAVADGAEVTACTTRHSVDAVVASRIDSVIRASHVL